MNYPYFGQTGQGATSVPPSNYLASLPAPAAAPAPTQVAAPASEVAVNSIQKGADK